MNAADIKNNGKEISATPVSAKLTFSSNVGIADESVQGNKEYPETRNIALICAHKI